MLIFAVRNKIREYLFRVSHGYRLEHTSGVFYAPTVFDDCHILQLCSSEENLVLFRDGIWQPSFFPTAYNAKQNK